MCLLLAVVGNIGYIYMMSRQAELLGKVSIALIEIFLVLAVVGFIVASTHVEGSSQ